MINPGTEPVEGAREELARANVDAFLGAVRRRAGELDDVSVKRRVAELTGEPVRDPGADRDGRFGWDLPLSDGRAVRLLMPGVDLALIRDDITAQAPCLYVNGNAWWWNGAVDSVAGEGLELA
ncbi:hypothetical protein Aab01nite_64720 [Paractinoplanes abujensis]|uniref:Uncharacterized protein n=1 Tax=Paractinoplanes abujensis TaxID=882441 RepID=A0A7W7G1E4_9ACTN|nr:hypothetical protein [Actinoplanes abujensis]MBB4692617.1 hypothetical protein [Actinoplanes abujensis]GID22882.1 hypothetical protein Aab01nite_64720 [Actinoplanes abujensis]